MRRGPDASAVDRRLAGAGPGSGLFRRDRFLGSTRALKAWLEDGPASRARGDTIFWSQASVKLRPRYYEQEVIDMREFASKERVSRRLGDATAGRATELDRECGPEYEVSAAAAQGEGTVRKRTELPSSVIVSSIRELLEQHPHFRGRTSLLAIESIGGSIVLSGRLPSYYLKQLLQEAVKGSFDVTNIDNHVEVDWPTS